MKPLLIAIAAAVAGSYVSWRLLTRAQTVAAAGTDTTDGIPVGTAAAPVRVIFALRVPDTVPQRLNEFGSATLNAPAAAPDSLY